jgi:hypothetical protein
LASALSAQACDASAQRKACNTPEFEHFAAIDWSGAVGPRQPGIAVAICEAGISAPALVRPGHIWSRQDVVDWLSKDLPSNAVVGLDLSPAFPFVDTGAYFPGWPKSPACAQELWALVDALCTSDPHLAASSFVDHPEASRHFRRHGGRTGKHFGVGRGRLRVAEERQRAHGLSPYSCFNLVGAAQVGKSSLTGMRVLHRVNTKLPVWPFDPLPENGPVIVEIYTSLAAREAGLRSGLSKMRDGAALDVALSALGSVPHAPLSRYTDHATDAILTAAWLRTVAHQPALWEPDGLDAVAQTEGWTFGVR